VQKPRLELNDLDIMADIIDSMEPGLSKEQSDNLSYRAYTKDSMIAFGLAMGLLHSMVQELLRLDPNLLTSLRNKVSEL
jgi:hypothetical protein